MGGKQLVFVDGVEGPVYDYIGEGTCIFSLDSRRVAYAAGKDGKQLVIVDGVEGPVCDGIVPNGPAFREGGVLEYLGASREKSCTGSSTT